MFKRRFSVALVAIACFPAIQETKAAPAGLEQSVGWVFINSCIDSRDRDKWSDGKAMRDAFRRRQVGATESISGFDIFEDEDFREYSLDGKIHISSPGASGGRASVYGGIRTNESHQYCYMNTEGADKEKITEALDDQKIRPRQKLENEELSQTYCSRSLKNAAVPHEIFVFSGSLLANDDLVSRGEVLIRYDLAETAMSCL